jgi:AAA15 family ATPase/GTPase
LSSTGIQLAGGSKIRADRPGSDKLMAMSFSSQGDTVKRLMFYLAAIASNKGKVLLLDNLYANVFPNHLVLLATAMIHNTQSIFPFNT